MALPAHAVRAMQIRLNSVSNEGRFTLQAETIFRPILSTHCTAVTEIRHMSPNVNQLQAVHFRLKSVCNEGHFTLETQVVSCPYLPSHSCGLTEIYHVAIRHMPVPAHALQAVHDRLKQVSNEGHFTLEAEGFSRSYLP
jgi:hypothetical protein